MEAAGGQGREGSGNISLRNPYKNVRQLADDVLSEVLSGLGTV